MTDQQRQDALDAAIQAEQAAYAVMRERVPELDLPLALRPQLTRRQQAAIAEYARCRERLRLVRDAYDEAYGQALAEAAVSVVVPMPRQA